MTGPIASADNALNRMPIGEGLGGEPWFLVEAYANAGRVLGFPTLASYVQALDWAHARKRFCEEHRWPDDARVVAARVPFPLSGR